MIAIGLAILWTQRNKTPLVVTYGQHVAGGAEAPAPEGA
jgi:hypothetical protein